MFDDVFLRPPKMFTLYKSVVCAPLVLEILGQGCVQILRVTWCSVMR